LISLEESFDSIDLSITLLKNPAQSSQLTMSVWKMFSEMGPSLGVKVPGL
jgi:hypothetical protein